MVIFELFFALAALFFVALCLWLLLLLGGITVGFGTVSLGLVIVLVAWFSGTCYYQSKVASTPTDPVDAPPDWWEPYDDHDDDDDDSNGNDAFNEGVKIAAIGSWFHDLP